LPVGVAPRVELSVAVESDRLSLERWIGRRCKCGGGWSSSALALQLGLVVLTVMVAITVMITIPIAVAVTFAYLYFDAPEAFQKAAVPVIDRVDVVFSGRQRGGSDADLPRAIEGAAAIYGSSMPQRYGTRGDQPGGGSYVCDKGDRLS